MKTDIFISYRRKNHGCLVARAIYERLVNDGYQVFLDLAGLERGEYWPQIEMKLREADDVIVVFPGECFSDGEDIQIFLKELRLAQTLNNRIIPVFMEDFDLHNMIPQEVKPILEIEGVRFSEYYFDAIMTRLRELLISVPVHKPSKANTAEFFNKVSENEMIFAEKQDDYPAVIKARLKTVVPLFSGIPYFTDENSVETTLSAPDFYLAFPDDLLSEISYSKSDFSSEDINLELYLQKLFLTDEQKTDFLNLLEKARYRTAKEFIERINGNLFNGSKYGVWASDANGRTADSFETPILHLDLYKTDYFTEKTMFNLFRSMCSDEKWNGITSREAGSINNLSIFRNSIGISLIVEIPSEQSIILTKRSKKAAFSEGKEWIYPSVTESVSETDYQRYSGLVELDLCVRRGLLEELGITNRYYDVDTIVYYSMFHEAYFSQDGITASVCLRNGIQRKHLLAFCGKDTKLEISDLIFLKLDPTEIKKFILDNLNDFRPQALYALLKYLAAKRIVINWDD